MKYGHVRAKSRALIAAAATGLVVVPMTGVVAVTLVSQEPLPTGPDADTLVAIHMEYGSAQADAQAHVTASATSEYDVAVPELTVEELPPPPPPRPAPVARPVANSADVSAAISGSAVIAEASKYVGTPYRTAGSTPDGFDCSGFVSYVYGQLGVSVPRSSSGWRNFGTRVSDPQPGDIIYTPGHVGIYAGPNLQIDSPTSGKSVQFRGIWQKNPIYIRVS